MFLCSDQQVNRNLLCKEDRYEAVSYTHLDVYKRQGINTILMHQPFALSKTQTPHTYAAKECVRSFTDIDETLHDPLVPELNVLEQCLAFIEACHMHGIRVLLEFCPGKLARDNTYYQKHPEWFYWMTNDELRNYHAPICNALPQKDVYKRQRLINVQATW